MTLQDFIDALNALPAYARTAQVRLAHGFEDYGVLSVNYFGGEVRIEADAPADPDDDEDDE